MSKFSLKLATAAVAMVVSGVASANTFSCVTPGAIAQCAAAESTVSWSVLASGSDTLFTISNAIGATSFVTGITFATTTSPSFQSSTGVVAYQSGGGANIPSFSGFDFSPVPPPATYGINGAESATFKFTGSFSESYFGAKVGIHVQGLIGEPPSVKLISATAPVPEPETYALMLAGLGVMGFVARRRKQHA